MYNTEVKFGTGRRNEKPIQAPQHLPVAPNFISTFRHAGGFRVSDPVEGTARFFFSQYAAWIAGFRVSDPVEGTASRYMLDLETSNSQFQS